MDIEAAKIECYGWIHGCWYLFFPLYTLALSLSFFPFLRYFSSLYYFYFKKKRTKITTHFHSAPITFLKMNLARIYKGPSVFDFTLKDGSRQKIIKLDDFLTSILYEIRYASIKFLSVFQRLWIRIIVMDIKMQPSEIWAWKPIPLFLIRWDNGI